MNKNQGKVFEEAFKKSVPNDVLIYRLPDAAQSFGGSNHLRFSRKNPFDYLMWDRTHLFALELKSVGGKSISFERTKEECGDIHYHQIVGLDLWSQFDVICGFVIEFRGIEKTIFISIADFQKLINTVDKKSFNYSDLNDFGCFTVILQRKVRTRYTYDIKKFINDVTMEGRNKK